MKPLHQQASIALLAMLSSGAFAQTATLTDEAETTNLVVSTKPEAANNTSSEAVAAISSSTVANEISARLQSGGQSLRIYGVTIGSLGAVKQFYASRGYSPVWLSGDKPSSMAKQLDELLGESINHGLNPFQYGYSEISQNIRSLQLAFESYPEELADFDILLTSAYFQFGNDLATGKTNPRNQFDTWNLGKRDINANATLSSALSSGSLSRGIDSLAPQYYQYQGMVNALRQLRRISAEGGWPAVKNWGTIEPGQSDGRVPTIREILYIMGDYKPVSQASLGDAVYSAELVEAVKSFQDRHGLAPDGIIGKGTFSELNVPVESRISKLEINMERWRWLPNSLGSRYVFVNIPDFRVKIIEGNRVTLDSKVVVGRTERPTPVFSDKMEYTVMNPYWHVPKTIAVEDKLPRLKKDPYAMAKSGIRVFRDGKEVDPGKVNWSKLSKDNFPYQLRQDPGDSNALGNIKFIFPNKHAIYLHDTPSRGLFNKNIRAYSSGCIRVEKYLDLAQYVLPDWSRDKIKQNTSGGKEKRVNLQNSLPVHILYFTAWVDESGKPHFRPDIYSKDRALASKLGL